MGIMHLGKYFSAAGVKVFLCLLCYCKILSLSYMTKGKFFLSSKSTVVITD